MHVLQTTVKFKRVEYDEDNQVLHGKAEWDSTNRLDLTEDMWPTRQEQINTSVTYNGFSEHTLQLIDNYVKRYTLWTSKHSSI